MTLAPRALSLILLLLTPCLAATAQTASQAAARITVSVSPRGVRFAALGAVAQVRLEVFGPSGESVHNSGFRPGNVYDWGARAADGRPLADGEYACVVTAREVGGRVSVKQGALLITAGEPSLQLAEAGGVGAPGQGGGSGDAGDESALASAGDGEQGAMTVTTHDGRDGALTSTAGDLTLRTGDVLSGSEREHVRVTSDGRVGVGTDKPEATLDVAGAVRASGGFRFPDGTTINSEGGRLKVTSAAGDEIPGPSAAGTGTVNRLAKWAETGGAGTLTNSTFEEDASGNVFNFHPTRVAVGGQQPFFEAQRNSASDILQRFWNTGSGGAKLRYVAGTGATSQIQLTDDAEWLSSMAGNNQIGLQFRVRAVGSTNSEAGLDSSAVMTLARTGNVGVGTTAPQAKLHVNGNVNFTGLRTEGGAAPFAPNVIGGWSGNSVSPGVTGATIGGGGQVDTIPPIADQSNKVFGSFGTVGGGMGHIAGEFATIGGGEFHAASGRASTVGGGSFNSASGASSTVGGGSNNTANNLNATVSGGQFNLAGAGSSTVGGGNSNDATGSSSTIGGGSSNSAENLSATVGGGNDNHATGIFSTVPGGQSNAAAGSYSFAAGQRAKANQSGAFVWADTTSADFASTAANQFLVRASGGVGINTNAPAAALDVAGSFRVNAGTLVVDAANGRVGVGLGAVTPVTTMHVRRDASAANTAPSPQLLLMNGAGGGGASVALDLSTTNTGANAPSARIQAVDNGNFSAHVSFMTKMSGDLTNPLVERVRLTTAGDLYVTEATKGVILKAPNGTCYRLQVDNSGSLLALPLGCP